MKRRIYENPVIRTVVCTPCRSIAQVSINGGSGENYGSADGSWTGTNNGDNEGYTEKGGAW